MLMVMRLMTRGSAVENEFQEENYKNDLVDDTTKNDDHVNDEGLSDGSHDQILDSHDTVHKGCSLPRRC